MKKQILNIGVSLSKKELKAINGGETCTVSCSIGNDITCEGSSCESKVYYCVYTDYATGRTMHTFCNNIEDDQIGF